MSTPQTLPKDGPRGFGGQVTPTRVRYKVVAFAVAMAGVTYLDRVTIGVVAPNIMQDLGLSEIQMGYVFSAFTIAYAAFEMPTAAWADRIGSRKVLTRIVAWWSAFTIFTATAFSYSSMLAVRFLFGIGEAGAWPNAARIFSRWVPVTERGRVQGVFFAGAHLAGGLTPAAVAWIALYLNWRAIFVLFGCVGFIWALSFYRWFRDEPREHPLCNDAEAEMIEATRGITHSHSGPHWTEGFKIPSVLPLCIQYVANTYGFYFFITWLPTYLSEWRGMGGAELAIFSGLPLLLSTVADISGGMTTDWLAKKVGIQLGYRLMGSVPYALAAVILYIGTQMENAEVAGLMIAVAGALSMVVLAPSWNTAISLGGENAGLVGAMMNTSGNIGGALSPIVLAYIVDRYGDWELPLIVLAGLYAVAAGVWWLIQPERAAAVE